VVVCGVTVLARLFDPGHHRQSRPAARTASYTRTVIIEAVTFHAVDGAQRGSGWRLRPWAESSLKRHRAVSEQPERRKGLPMSKVKYISSTNEIPAGQKYVLVMYGEEYEEARHPLGLTITVASTVSQLSFLTAVHTAKEIARAVAD
jgi:hypothetical protein